MFHASMRCASISATAHASACSRMRSANCVRRSGTSCLETSSPTMRRFGFRITAAATTGPNKAPRPASSKPAMRVQPSLRAARSKREEQRRLISAAILAREVKLGTRSQSERKTIPPPAKNFLPSLTASPTRPSMSGPTRNRLHSKGELMDRAILNIALCALLAVAACAFASGSSAQGLSSADLTRFRSIGSVALSPDGHRVAYTVVMRDRPGRPYGQLWLMDLATQKSSRIGGEKDSSGNPLWSPDGKWLAYDGRHDDKSGLFVARPDGSEIAFLTSTKGTNSPLPGTGKEVTWSPDSKQIAFISSTPGAEAAQASGDPMVITRYLYKPDAGEGKTRFNDNQRLHIFVVDISSKQVRQLTRGETDEHSIDWSPDGREILFVSNREPNQDEFFNYDVFALRLADGGIRRITATEYNEYEPLWSPDGKRIIYRGTRRGLTDRETTMEDTHVWMMNADGSDRREIDAVIDNRQGAPQWGPDGNSVYFTVQERGSIHLARLPLAGGKPEYVVNDTGLVGGWVAGTDGTIAYRITFPRDNSSVYL